MGKHIADQPRDRSEGTRIREFSRIQREQGAGGPHMATQILQRRATPGESGSSRTREFLLRERQRQD